MAAAQHRSSEPWEATSDFEWTDRAYGLLEQGLLHAEVNVVDGVLSTRVWGNCPRCEGLLNDHQVPTVVDGFGAARGHGTDVVAGAGPRVVVVDVTCGCGLAHAGVPEGTTGCGVSFRVELEAEDAGPLPQGTP